MPNVNAIYQSQFLNAGQLKGQSRRVTIERATQEVLGQGERAQQKIVLKFSGVKPRLPLNKTNALALSAAWGPESGNWIGHIIELVPQRVLFQGAFVDSIRINISRDGAPPAAPPPSEPVVPSGGGLAELEDDIPW